MKEWDRSTKKLLPETIQSEIAAAIQEHIQSYNLGPILDDYLICIETVSNKKKKPFYRLGLFDLIGDKHRIEVAIVTPRWLVVGTRGEKPDSVAALTVQLKDVVVMDHMDHPAYKAIPDTGLHVTGIFTGRVGMQGNQRISIFLGLGEEPAADEFKDALLKGMQSTRL